MLALNLISGAVVGLSLGLTGGGGSIFAVPLLVSGLGVRPREAIGVSLAAVGLTALVGAVGRLRGGQVEVKTGLLFAAAGTLGTPAGAWLGGRVPEALLLVLFAGLMVAVAVRMWLKASRHPEEARAVRAAPSSSSEPEGPACRRDPSGRLAMTSRCAAVLAAAGLVTGVLSGLFGVGGGFVIVPALVLASGMDIHRAVATSLLVIALVSAAGVASYLAAGRPLPPESTTLFAAGGVVGMGLGSLLARRITGPGLQRIFAAAMVVVAAFIVTKSVT
jgi:uncharacterized membrane protein YfcA